MLDESEIARRARLEEIASFDLRNMPADELRTRLRTLGRVTASATIAQDQEAISELISVAHSINSRPTDDPEREFRRGVSETLLALLAEALREARSNEVLNFITQTPYVHQLLIDIDRHGDSTAQQVSDRTNLDAGDAAQILSQLVSHGLARMNDEDLDQHYITGLGERVLDAVGRSPKTS